MATATKTKGGKRANSKATAIRAYLAEHPGIGPTAVSTALKAKGIKVSAAHVSNVKAKMLTNSGKATFGAAAANGAGHRKPGRPGRKPAAAREAGIVAQLIEARKFAAQVGGVENAVGLLQTLAKLQ